MDADAGRVASQPGSRPTDQAPSGLGASRFDPSRGELLALADRCEAATGPDSRLGAEIVIAIRGFPSRAYHQSMGMRPRGAPLADPMDWAATFLGDDPTASLDAAMTLVPEGWGWNISNPNERAIASGLLKERTPVRGEVEYGFDQRYIVAAATSALALCAAALRARAAQR